MSGSQYQFSFGAGVVAGDIVSYYVVAQDNAGTPNVGSSPSAGAAGFTANPPAASTPPTTPSSYNIVGSISGTKTVGAGGDFATLTLAINGPNGINNSVLTGAVVLTLTDASYSASETFPITINANSGSNPTNTITIKPAGGATPTISGSVASGALIMVKANYVTIDGSISGSNDRSLTITNTGATAPNVVVFGSTGTTPITDGTLKNCVLINSVTSASAVVISDSATVGNAGYFSNIAIQNNSVQKALIGVYANGGTTPQNGANVTYTLNDLSTSGANAIRNIGLYMQGVNGATVTQNTIGNFEIATAENDTAIWLASGTINATVSGNIVTALAYSGTSANAPFGIRDSGGATASGNSITSNTVTTVTSNGTTAVYGIENSSGGTLINRNKVQGVINTNTTTYGAYGINVSAGNNVIMRNNFVSNVTHDMTGGGAFTTSFGVFGVRIAAGTGHQIYHNSVNLYGLMPGRRHRASCRQPLPC